jgi:hypothetical protein
MAVVAPQAMHIMFGQTFLTDPHRAEQRAEMRRRLLQNDRINIGKAINGVFSRQGVYQEKEQVSRCVTFTILTTEEFVRLKLQKDQTSV